MSKTSKKSTKKAPPALSSNATQIRVKAAPTNKVLKVAKTDQKFAGARASWYAALLAHDGQSAESFVADCTKTPPAMPKSGKAEDPRGWLKWFVRIGAATLS